MGAAARVIAEPQVLDDLFQALLGEGYEIVGPTVRDGAIVYSELQSPAELPHGLEDEQAGGRYRLRQRTDGALFAYVVGPHSFKRYLHPPVVTLWKAHREGRGFRIAESEAPVVKRAFFGVRACELQAIAVQDRVFRGGAHIDPIYATRRANCLIVAVNCTRPGGTCFCASMGTGPRVGSGFDLALTELLDEGHRLLIESGSARGEALVQKLPHRAATPADLEAAQTLLRAAEGAMGRALATEGLRERLLAHYEDPHWDQVAARCLTCTNCTQVCPTCFCTTVEDVTDLTGDEAERQRRWDSCFTMDFSYIHGGSVRTSAGARYRQWITHKLGSWHDQFGSSGCVGCGRCITWCPVGIDITVEAQALDEGASGRR